MEWFTSRRRAVQFTLVFLRDHLSARSHLFVVSRITIPGSSALSMARSFANVGRSARQSSSLPSSLSATALLPQVRYTPRPSPSASSWRSTAVKPPLAVTLSSPRVEHQQLLKQKLAAQSFRCVESTLGKVSHEKLRGLALDDHDEPCQFQVKDEPFGELEGCVRDHQGELVTWTWLQQTEGQIW